MNAFEHVLGQYAKVETDDPILTACLTAWATNMGLGRMGEISDIIVRADSGFCREEKIMAWCEAQEPQVKRAVRYTFSARKNLAFRRSPPS